MNDLIFKYNTLSPEIQKEVNDFLDFMLMKYKGKTAFGMKTWKAKIMNISTWTKDEIQIFEENRQQFDQWKAKIW